MRSSLHFLILEALSCLRSRHRNGQRYRLVDRALANGADEHTVRALRAIPPVEYRSLSEVLSSVPLRDEQDVVQPGQQAQARRTHTKPGLAESAKDVSPPNPIVEELGTTGKADPNRGAVWPRCSTCRWSAAKSRGARYTGAG